MGKMKVKGGFTLIELMLVILIIGVLIGMLLPAINAASVFVKIKDTENRISTLSGYIEQYKQVFGDYPPSHFYGTTGTPYQSLTPSSWPDPDYPTILHPMDFSLYTNPTILPLGGGFLYYMLMGPNQMGWSTTNPAVNSPVVAANWEAPTALTKMIYLGHPIISPYPTDGHTNYVWDHAMYYFEDGFGCAGFLQGTIQYSLRVTRTYNPVFGTYIATGTFYSADLDGAYRQTSNVWSNQPGVGVAWPSWQRLTSQCPGPYLLLSAGPDRIFGYVITDPTTGLTRVVKGIPNPDPNPLTNGVSDDITNFSHN